MELGVFVAKYWIEIAFGLVCAAIAWVAKHYVSLIKKEKQQHEEEIITTMTTELKEHSKQMEQNMAECSANLLHIVETDRENRIKADEKIEHSIEIVQNGVLSMQGRNFKNDCKKLLDTNHTITLQEYEALLQDHTIYNSLGGNHEGDALFSMVEAKYKNTVGTV